MIQPARHITASAEKVIINLVGWMAIRKVRNIFGKRRPSKTLGESFSLTILLPFKNVTTGIGLMKDDRDPALRESCKYI
jgi:hypothetical protein